MVKDDVIQFMDEIKDEEDESVVIERTRKFIEKLLEEVYDIDENGNITTKYFSISLPDTMVDLGTIDICHKYFGDKIPYLSILCSRIAGNTYSRKASKCLGNVMRDIESNLNDSNGIDENSSEEELKLYDGMISAYIGSFLKSNRTINKTVIDFAKRLMEIHATKGLDYRNTQFFKTVWIPYARSDKEILDCISIKSKEEYEKYLFSTEFEYGIEATERSQYDLEAYEYLVRYGTTEVSYDQKEMILNNLIISFPGVLKRSITCGDYFMRSNDPEEIDVLCSQGLNVLKDLFIDTVDSRIKQGKKCVRTPSNNEFKFLKTFANYLKSYDGEYEEKFDGDFQSVIKQKIKLTITSLYSYFEDNVEDFVRYAHKVAKEFQNSSYPMHIISSLIGDMDVCSLLEKNFDVPNLSDKTVNERGLTRFDCADIALSCMIEADFSRGKECFFDPNKRKKYEENGINIYDSRAIRKLIECYIDNPKIKRDELIEQEIIEFVKHAVKKEDFDLFHEQQISDLIQLSKNKGNSLGKIVEEEVKKGLEKNPSYADLSIDNSNKIVEDFLSRNKYVTLDESNEEEFDKFLKALSVIRMNSNDGTFPKEVSDFLISQAIDENSLINRKKDKYSSTVERAVENLGLIDFLEQDGVNSSPSVYKIRDFIVMHQIMGMQDSYGDIILARNRINKLFKGKLNTLEDMFHENTHASQDERMKQFSLKSYNEYMMIKDKALYASNQLFYKRNTDLMYIEIEANESGSAKLADYISGVLNPMLEARAIDDFENERIQEAIVKFEQKRLECLERNKKYLEAYESAIEKREGNVNELFEHSILDGLKRRFIRMYPALAYEYHRDGTLKTTSEQIAFAYENREQLDLQVMRQVIKHSCYKDNSLDTLAAVDRFMQVAETEEEIEFISGVAADKIPESVANFKAVFINTDNFENKDELQNKYLLLTRVISMIEQRAQTNNNFRTFCVPDKDGITPLDSIKELRMLMEERVPELADGASNIANEYEQLKGVVADIEGKDTVLLHEVRHCANKNERREIVEE